MSLVPPHRTKKKKKSQNFQINLIFFIILPVIQRASGEYVANNVRGRYCIRNAYQKIRNQLKYAEFANFGK